jgi:hypothetical protein
VGGGVDGVAASLGVASKHGEMNRSLFSFRSLAAVINAVVPPQQFG